MSMMSSSAYFEYRAWPSAGMPHTAALHHMLGTGVSSISTDTYILLPDYPQCLMILRGGTRFEIKLKTGERAPVTIWKTPVQSAFPLRRSVVRTLQAAFPVSELPHRISAPVDILSWLGGAASIFTLTKRVVRFQSANCVVELAQIDAPGRRVETFCLTAKRYDTITAALAMIPGPRLPNQDYGSWLQRRVPAASGREISQNVRKLEQASAWRAAFLSPAAGSIDRPFGTRTRHAP